MQTATKTRPRFRTDLVAQPIEEKGQVFVDVTDPDTGSTFRFYEIEYSVASAMDGERDLSALRAWARDEIGVEPTDDELTTVIATLDELGYLAGAEGDDAVGLGGAGRSSERTSEAQAPVEDVELGKAGGGLAAQAAVPATSSPSPSAPAGAGEVSFEGLMDDDAAVPSEVSRAGTHPFERSNKVPLQADEGDDIATAVKSSPQGAEPSLRRGAHRADDEDGPTNIPAPASAFDEEEVSVDLSDHLSIGTDDVKEAVRQSRVMEAASPPDDDDAPAGATEGRKSDPGAAAKASGDGEAAAAAAAAGAAGPGRAPAEEPKAPGEAPSAQKEAAKARPTEPPSGAVDSEGSPVRLAVLVVLLLISLAGGGYYIAFHTGLLGGDSPAAASPSDAEAEVQPPPTSVLSAEEVEPAFLEAEHAGEVLWVAEAGDPVQEGDDVVWLDGYDERAEALEFQLGEEERLQDLLDQATAEDDRRRMRRLEERVEEAQESVAEAEEELSRYRAVAPRDGLFAPDVAEGDELEEGDPLGSVAAEARTLGVFEVDAVGTLSAGQAVTLASEGAGEVVSCEVIVVDEASLTVACPPGGALGPGDTATLEGY